MPEKFGRIKNQLEKGSLSPWTKMYEISGQDKISSHGYDRYKKDKGQDAKIAEAAKNQETLGEESPENDKSTPRHKVVKALNKAKQSERPLVIEKLLRGEDPLMRKAAAGSIFYIVPNYDEVRRLTGVVIGLVEKGLQDKDIGKQKEVVDLIGDLPEDDAFPLIEIGLTSSSAEIQESSLRQMRSERAGSTDEKADERRISLIKTGFGSPNPNVRKEAINSLKCVRSQEKLIALIEAGLSDSDIEVQRAAMENFSLVRDANEKSRLFEIVKAKNLGEEFVKPMLYTDKERRQKPINETKFSRQEFIKTGSGTTLLGGKLMGKTIVRHVSPSTFLTWQSLYEDHETWKNEGFNYVPIEPIQSYRLNNKGLVNVYSGVLDLSLRQWQKKRGGTFGKSLEEQERKIFRVLEKLKIEHGHPHPDNFCLRFFRDENGKIDFEQTPRLYLIDFDRASSE